MSIVQISYHLKIIYSLTSEPICVHFHISGNRKWFNAFPAISFRNWGKHHYTTCGSPIASLLGHNSIRSSLQFPSEIGASTIIRLPAISFRNWGKHHYTTCGSPIASLLGHNSIRSSLQFPSEIGASTIIRLYAYNSAKRRIILSSSLSTCRAAFA